jgi:hypothetical protein
MDIVKEPYVSCTPRLPLDQHSKDHEDLHILLQMRHGMKGHCDRLAEYIEIQSYQLVDVLIDEFEKTDTGTADKWQNFWKRVAPISRIPRFYDRTAAYELEQPFQRLSTFTAAEIQKFLDDTRRAIQPQISLLVSSLEDKAAMDELPRASNDQHDSQNDRSGENCSCQYQLGIEHAAREGIGRIIKIGVYLNLVFRFEGALPSGEKEVKLRFCFGSYLTPAAKDLYPPENEGFKSQSIAPSTFSTHGSTILFTNNSIGMEGSTMWSFYVRSLLDSHESKPRTATSNATMDQGTRGSSGSMTSPTV